MVAVGGSGSGATPIWRRLSLQGSRSASTVLASAPARSTGLQPTPTPRHGPTSRPLRLVNQHFQSPMPVPCCARGGSAAHGARRASSDRSLHSAIALATPSHTIPRLSGSPSALNLTLGVPAPKTEPSPNSRIHLGPVGVAPLRTACHKVGWVYPSVPQAAQG